MPVEIRELVIKAVTASDAKNADDDKPQSQGVALDNETIIQECVGQVLRILKKSKER